MMIGLYIGSNAILIGQKAMLMERKVGTLVDRTSWIAQFDFPSWVPKSNPEACKEFLSHPLFPYCYGWHAFPRADFHVCEDSV
jgi:hypothetical protein